MLGPELRVAVHHHARFPAAKILELIAARTDLAVPRCPRMPEIVKPEIRNAGFLNRRMPCAVGHLPRNRPGNVKQKGGPPLHTVALLLRSFISV